MSDLFFTTNFFRPPLSRVPSHASPFLELTTKHGNQIWAFLDLPNILMLSVVSRMTAAQVISKENAGLLIKHNSRTVAISNFQLSFSSDITLGMLRRVLLRVVCGSQGVISIDIATGRVMMDIGSAFNGQDIFLASEVHALPLGSEEDEVEHKIEKFLEAASYDEYDDFNPRHPQPREKTHRRGDSYFNSDIESCVEEALSQQAPSQTRAERGNRKQQQFNMSDIASLAINLNSTDEEGILKDSRAGLISCTPSFSEDSSNSGHRRPSQNLQSDAKIALCRADSQKQ